MFKVHDMYYIFKESKSEVGRNISEERAGITKSCWASLLWIRQTETLLFSEVGKQREGQIHSPHSLTLLSVCALLHVMLLPLLMQLGPLMLSITLPETVVQGAFSSSPMLTW